MSKKQPTHQNLSGRYARQMVLPGFSEDVQKRISQSHVGIIGAGGLGSAVLTYLAAGGVGKLTIIDGDTVELINLHRQVIHNPEMLDVPKVESAREYLEILNPEVILNCINERLSSGNAAQIFSECDLVCDCSDNFETRYLIDDVCHELMLPVVYGAVTGWHGQVTVFLHNEDPAAEKKSVKRLRDLFSSEPQKGSVPKSDVAGILGPVAGMLGCMMATEAMKLAGGLEATMASKIISIDGMNMSFQEIKY